MDSLIINNSYGFPKTLPTPTPLSGGSIAGYQLQFNSSNKLEWFDPNAVVIGVVDVVDSLDNLNDVVVNYSNSNMLLGSNPPSLGSGQKNTALGNQSLKSLTNGNQNTAFGNSSLKQNNQGDFNTAIGSESMENNTTGIELSLIHI